MVRVGGDAPVPIRLPTCWKSLPLAGWTSGSGLTWIAAQAGIKSGEIAAIGDQINDVAMLSAAGCGIAMGNAIDAVKKVARHVTLDNNQSGVAHAIEQLMSGIWG